MNTPTRRTLLGAALALPAVAAVPVMASHSAAAGTDAELLRLGAAGVLGGHDHDAVRGSAYVTQDQRQNSLSDAAETDEYDPARKFHMHFVAAHNFIPIFSLPRRWCGRPLGEPVASLQGGAKNPKFRANAPD